MKQYPQTKLDDKKRIFGYRLSPLRQISENEFGFGWLTCRFRFFLNRSNLPLETAGGL